MALFRFHRGLWEALRVRVEGVEVKESEREQEGFPTPRQHPWPGQKASGPWIPGRHHFSVSRSLPPAAPGPTALGQVSEKAHPKPQDLVHFAAAHRSEGGVSIRKACLLRLWQSWLGHRVDICLSLKAY